MLRGLTGKPTNRVIPCLAPGLRSLNVRFKCTERAALIFVFTYGPSLSPAQRGSTLPGVLGLEVWALAAV